MDTETGKVGFLLSPVGPVATFSEGNGRVRWIARNRDVATGPDRELASKGRRLPLAMGESSMGSGLLGAGWGAPTPVGRNVKLTALHSSFVVFPF